MTIPLQAAVVTVMTVVGTPTSRAQWSVISLNSPGSLESFGHSGDGMHQVGQWRPLPTGRHAALWSGGPTPVVDLHPSGAVNSEAFSVHEGVQVGFAEFPPPAPKCATMWTGRGASWINLNPPGTRLAFAYGVHAGQQVGMVKFDGPKQAALWFGSAASWVNLHPPESAESTAWAVHSNQQVGYFTPLLYLSPRACYWTGSAASLVSLHPETEEVSEALGTSGFHQVGYAGSIGARRAALWSGSAETWVDLNPPDAWESVAFAVHREFQVGVKRVDLWFRPVIWTGTAASCEQLPYPPGTNFRNGGARAVWSHDGTLYVAGYGQADFTGFQALLWSRPLPSSCYVNCDGSTIAPIANVADFTCFMQRYAAGDLYADCDQAAPPVLSPADFVCFLGRFAAGCP